MADLNELITQAIADFDGVKAAIEESGVPVPYDTDTKEYGRLVREAVNLNSEAGFYWSRVKAFARIFYQAIFPENTDLTLDISNHWDTNIASYDLQYAFSNTKGIKSVKIISTKKKPINLTCTFASAKTEKVDLSDCPLILTLNSAFQYNNTIKEIIGELDCSYAAYVTNLGNSCFNGSTALENIRFKPNSIPFSIGFTHSYRLTDESIQSIIDGLADKTGDTAQKLDLHADIVAKLTDEQTVQIYSKNWSVI